MILSPTSRTHQTASGAAFFSSSAINLSGNWDGTVGGRAISREAASIAAAAASFIVPEQLDHYSLYVGAPSYKEIMNEMALLGN